MERTFLAWFTASKYGRDLSICDPISFASSLSFRAASVNRWRNKLRASCKDQEKVIYNKNIFSSEEILRYSQKSL